MNNQKVDLSQYKNELSITHKLYRICWTILWALLIKPIPRNMLSGWKIFLYRLFGAKLHKTAVIYSTAKVYMPCNLVMSEYSCLGPEVDCYNVDMIFIGSNTTISQKAYLCTSSHDITKRNLPLITSPIYIEDEVWIAADAFVGMGVRIGKGAVVGARSSVVKDVKEWTVVAGNPARIIKNRYVNE